MTARQFAVRMGADAVVCCALGIVGTRLGAPARLRLRLIGAIVLAGFVLAGFVAVALIVGMSRRLRPLEASSEADT